VRAVNPLCCARRRDGSERRGALLEGGRAGALPFIITGLRLAFQRAWIAVVGAEMLAASSFGLGW
jgi:NitT/TauT family transport system permease protein